MNVNKLIWRLESLGYLFVTIVDEIDGEMYLTAVDPAGYQIEIKITGDTVLDRVIGSEFWDIMFIGEESFL